MNEENKKVAKRFVDDVVNGRNYDVIDEIFSPEFVFHMPFSPEPLRGPESMKQTASRFTTAFSDLKATIEDLFAEGDRVALRLQFAGTNDGEMMGMAATNEKAEWSVVHLLTIRDGQIAEDRATTDRMALMEQLGHLKQQA